MSREDWEVFDDIKEERRQKRRNNLATHEERFEKEGWSKHDYYHWYKFVMIDGVRTKVEFWPSSNKYKVGQKYHRGSLPRKLKEIIHDTRSTSTPAGTENSEAGTENQGTREE